MKTTCSCLYPFLIILVLFSACSNSQRAKLGKTSPSGEGFDTVSYTFKSINKYDKGCDSTRDTTCRIVYMKYHVFDGHPLLNDSITAKLLAIYPFEQASSGAKSSLEEQAQDFMDKYAEFKKEPYSQGRKYELRGFTRILSESENLLTIQLDAYTYSGGAHGASFTRYFNYDIGSRRVLSLDDVMNVGYLDPLTKIAARIFKQNEGLDPQKPLKPGAYFFQDNEFSLAANYVFTSEGLLFLYNQYEIKPYAAGKTELIIPYDQIKELINPESVLQQFLH